MKLTFCAVLFVSILSFAYSKDRNNKPYKVVCYFESWNDYAKGDDHFTAENINPHVCTHVIYAFAVLKNNTIQLSDPGVDGLENHGHDMIHRTVALRKLNPNLTVMISLGGWAEGSTKYSEMVKSDETRHELVQSVVKFLQKYDLDGVDLDWEYPTFVAVESGDRKEGHLEDKANYVHLLSELSEAFKPHNYLISAAVAGGQYYSNRAYDVVGLNKYLDFINLMTYAYHGTWDGVTGHDSPLGSAPTDPEDTGNIQSTVSYWIKLGAEPKKLILGIPLYGVGYKLAVANASGFDLMVGAKTNGSVDVGTYGKLCQTLKQPGWVVHWDAYAQAPFATNGHDWVSYENSQSVQKKLEYVVKQKLGGLMVWAVDGDDGHGKCGEGKFPLMKLQMKILNKVEVSDTQH